jgi:hypothetical protein
LTYLERQKCYGLDKKILFKKYIFDLEVKGQGPTKVITVCDTPPYAAGKPVTQESSLDVFCHVIFDVNIDVMDVRGRPQEFVAL